MTDAGVTALGIGCDLLQKTDLDSCDEVTDAGISALDAGCGQLQSIQIYDCRQVIGSIFSAELWVLHDCCLSCKLSFSSIV